jgi:uncharacterized membrane protein YidH (DUF202 family)
VLAAEHTFAAWVRTGLMSLAAGVGAKTTLGGVLPEWVVVVTGSVAGNVRGLLLARGLGAALAVSQPIGWPSTL